MMSVMMKNLFAWELHSTWDVQPRFMSFQIKKSFSQTQQGFCSKHFAIESVEVEVELKYWTHMEVPKTVSETESE